jgi:tetratricopeptide (TPR) repeat protein
LVLHAIPNALYHIFGIYQPISVNEYNEKIAVLPSGYVDYLNKKYETIEKLLALKTRIRFNDFRAIEAAIIKNKAFDEFGELSNLAEKQYPKSMLANYELALMYEYTGDFQKARKYYQAAYEREEIGNLTQDLMFDKMEEMKNAKTPASTETTPAAPNQDPKP